MFLLGLIKLLHEAYQQPIFSITLKTFWIGLVCCPRNRRRHSTTKSKSIRYVNTAPSANLFAQVNVKNVTDEKPIFKTSSCGGANYYSCAKASIMFSASESDRPRRLIDRIRAGVGDHFRNGFVQTSNLVCLVMVVVWLGSTSVADEEFTTRFKSGMRTQ